MYSAKRLDDLENIASEEIFKQKTLLDLGLGGLNSIAKREDFDIMIDDGLHTFEAGICLLENSFSRLAANGIYIIEDVLQNDAPKYRQWLDSKGYIHDLILLYRKGLDLGDNILILIRKA